MYSALIIFLLAVFFAVAFSLQNSEPITLNFFSLTIEASRAVVFLSSLASGVLLGALAFVPSLFKKRRLITQQQKTITKLEAEAAERNLTPFDSEELSDEISEEIPAEITAEVSDVTKT